MSKLEDNLDAIIKLVEKFGLKWKWSTYKGRKAITIYESEGVKKVKYTIDDVMREVLGIKKDIVEINTRLTKIENRIDNLVVKNNLKE